MGAVKQFFMHVWKDLQRDWLQSFHIWRKIYGKIYLTKRKQKAFLREDGQTILCHFLMMTLINYLNLHVVIKLLAHLWTLRLLFMWQTNRNLKFCANLKGIQISSHHL